MRRVFTWIGIGAVVVLGVWAAYTVATKFSRDRQSAMFSDYSHFRNNLPASNPPTRQVKTYTAEELEALRKQGKVPGQQPYIPAGTSAEQDAAVQRSLRTLEEINRINQMNQRMQEQQQRQQQNR